MKPTKEIDFNNVEELTRRLLTGKAITTRFSLEIPERNAANGIFAAMKAVVTARGQNLVKDEDTLNHIRLMAKWIINPEGKPGLMLKGKYGNGKTTLLKAFKWLVEYTSEKTLGINNGYKVCLVTAKHLADLCLSEEGRKEYRKYFDVPILAIDDMGDEPKEVIHFGMIYNPVMDLLLHRYDRKLVTLISTNLTSKEIESHYSGRIRDRLREMMHEIIFENPSYRR